METTTNRRSTQTSRNYRPGGQRPGGQRPGGGRPGGRKFFSRRKVCRFCVDSNIKIDYKRVDILRDFLTERGKIVPRRISGNCAKHQREVTAAIKRARNIALLPYVVTEG
ncbi:MAG: 30S ribosomal protein S18 [Deltaproteobacteria bacterium]|nr:30S ribosomal protein S18 [Deltaproteobacteria bacterium]MBN2688495.1 30S ribosomal protein S18 [Deltaproteobacteria bacterium]